MTSYTHERLMQEWTSVLCKRSFLSVQKVRLSPNMPRLQEQAGQRFGCESTIAARCFHSHYMVAPRRVLKTELKFFKALYCVCSFRLTQRSTCLSYNCSCAVVSDKPQIACLTLDLDPWHVLRSLIRCNRVRSQGCRPQQYVYYVHARTNYM